MVKCPLFGFMNSEHMSKHSSTKNFGKFQCKQGPATLQRDLFLVLICFGQKIGHLRT